jgi:hypothetical protein
MVDHPPNVVRIIKKLQADLRNLRNLTRPETLTFTEAAPSLGVACVSGTMVNTHETNVYRSGDRVWADVALGTGAGSVMEAQFSVPALSLTGAAVASASGGTEQVVRITLDLPDSWDSGSPYLMYVQARRVSGADSTTVRVLRAWQR